MAIVAVAKCPECRAKRNFFEVSEEECQCERCALMLNKKEIGKLSEKSA